jgi:hypothetical protein
MESFQAGEAPSLWRLPSRLEQLDRIAVGIFDLCLLAAWTNLDLIAEMNSRIREHLNERREILDLQNHAIPPARFLLPPVRHWA